MRIGLIGATAIAERAIVGPAGRHDDVRVRAVAARDAGRAAEFAERNGIPRVHADYGALLEDPGIDTVYVSLHNSAHHPWAVRAARSGRHVIVEKPLCLGPDELDGIRRAALAGGVLVTEAVPTAGHAWQPAVRAMIRDGRHGRLRSVRTRIRFGVPAPGSYRDRPELGGGVFLDSAAYWLQAVQATAGLAGATGSGRALLTGPYGADREFEARLDWADGRSAELRCEVGERHLAQHEFVFEAARVRLRNFLLPAAGALPLNLVVEHDDGTKKVLSFPPVAYYDSQLDRVRALLRGGAGGDGGGGDDTGEGGGAGAGELDRAGERVALMASIHRRAMCATERQE
ncbi:Gfo/Idh/MocA family protein [Streptomyces lycii]|uniref:Gfo/Idh/MocA family oxidoreductase n=1 Tax=Streptomyces lycii TaxID=2654337 RepID=A0ABQ7FPS4_9ACTN|nr:Gfo/Idh/MocA family oxidoreductase [Streptomyces lycii]KAF4410835.1 Gfo/Idh/MocA family oxidoreductase [Streptomyces lycii]